MTIAIQFALLGLGVSAAYALLAQGLVLIYRGSGVVNFAHGAFALLGAFLFFDTRQEHNWPVIPALVVSVLGVAILGVAVYVVVMRPLRDASTVTSAVATLGMLILIQGVVILIWGSNPEGVTNILPVTVLSVGGGVTIGLDQVLLFAIAVVLTAALWAAARFTPVGLALRATTENPLAAASLGWSAEAMGTLTWGLGAALAALAGILVAPLTSIDSTAMPLLVIPVLAAALLGSLSSFPLTLLAATVIGIAESEMVQYVNVQGLSTALPFVVIAVIMLVRGRGLPARAFVTERLPEIGTGRIRLAIVVPAVVAGGWLIWAVLPFNVLDALTVTFAWAMILLSVVVLLGYTGQLSLAQFALGAVAALLAVHMIDSWQLSFAVAALLAVGATILIGAIMALPALRTRGIDLGVITLGVAVSITAIVFTSAALTGGIVGLPSGTITLFGWNINPIVYDQRYTLVVFVLFVCCAVVAANLRRGKAGRRLIAVRTNERAAAALGINVVATKLYAFTVAAVMAALGGIMLAFQQETLLFANISPLESVLAVAYAVVGGVGFVAGSVFGATLVTGSIGTWFLTTLFPNANPAWLSVLGGVSVLALVVLNQNGIVSAQIAQFRWTARHVKRVATTSRRLAIRAPAAAVGLERPEPAERPRVSGATLDVRDVSVRFGGVQVLRGVSMVVNPGEVVGLIGPNGAGKTTMIDVITGFVPAAGGEIRLNGEPITRWAAHRRTRQGLTRSFQSLELFEASTVRENVTIGSEGIAGPGYLRSLVRPRSPELSSVAVAAVEEFGLGEFLDVVVQELPYGVRRLVAIARAIAGRPSILMLDEPAAGLSRVQVTELVSVIRRLVEEWGMGVLLVEHDMGFVMDVCDRITVLNFGNQVASGTPDVVRRDPAVIAAYLGESDADDEPAAVGLQNSITPMEGGA